MCEHNRGNIRGSGPTGCGIVGAREVGNRYGSGPANCLSPCKVPFAEHHMIRLQKLEDSLNEIANELCNCADFLFGESIIEKTKVPNRNETYWTNDINSQMGNIRSSIDDIEIQTKRITKLQK